MFKLMEVPGGMAINLKRIKAKKVQFIINIIFKPRMYIKTNIE